MRAYKLKCLIGVKYGNLTVVSDAHPFIDENGKKHRVLECVCQCGNTVQKRAKYLQKGHKVDCGCSKHRLSHTPIYWLWTNIKKRCFNPSSTRFFNYGGRGITMCDEWNYSFLSFCEWALNNGWEVGKQIDRINNNGNYEPTNCRFVTPKENTRNRSNCYFILYKGREVNLSDICDELGIRHANVSNIKRRNKISIQDAFDGYLKKHLIL